MKKIFILILVLLFVFPFGSTTKADQSSIFVNRLPYSVNTIFADNGTILVGTKNGLYVSKDNGKTFSSFNKGLSDYNITGIARVSNNIFVGTKEGGLYFGSLDSNMWNSLSDRVDCPTVTSISSEGNSIYVTSICSGFYVSFDGGKTWISRNGGLPTLKTTTFIKTPSGRCFLGTDRYGLFYSDNLGESCSWITAFKDYSITSISYLGDLVFLGTNTGLFSSPINNVNFKKLEFIGGNPYITKVLNASNRIFVAVRSVGLYISLDGSTFFKIFDDEIVSPTAIFFDTSTNFLYIGDESGGLYKIDISKPFLLVPPVINLGNIKKGESVQFKITFLNAGLTKLSGSIGAPSFIKPSYQNFTDNSTITFVLNTTNLDADKYNIPLKFSYNNSFAVSYVSFNVVQQTTTLKLVIDSNVSYINNSKFILDSPPFIDPKTNRTLVPIRFISEAFGADVQWDGISRVVTVSLNNRVVKLQIGNNQALVDDKFVPLEQPPVIVKGRTFVPIRFIAETFGADVQWDGTTKTITITYKP